jgi:hypothetical protein
MKPVEQIGKLSKKSNQSFSRSFNPLSPLSWSLHSVSALERRRLQIVPVCGLPCCPAGTLRSPRLKISIRGSGWLRFLRGLEEKILDSPNFRILSLKRLSCLTKPLKHTAKRTPFTEPRTLHANRRSLVKSFFARSETSLD